MVGEIQVCLNPLPPSENHLFIHSPTVNKLKHVALYLPHSLWDTNSGGLLLLVKQRTNGSSVDWNKTPLRVFMFFMFVRRLQGNNFSYCFQGQYKQDDCRRPVEHFREEAPACY